MRRYLFTKEEIFKKHNTECHKAYYGNNEIDRANEVIRYIVIRSSPDNYYHSTAYKRIGDTEFYKELKGFSVDYNTGIITDEPISWIKIKEKVKQEAK